MKLVLQRDLVFGMAAYGGVAACLICVEAAFGASKGPRLIAAKPLVIWRSPNPKEVSPRSPGICRLVDGRLVLTMEYSLGGSRFMPGTRRTPDGKYYRGLAFVSDDGGRTVRQTGQYPLWQGRPFTAGDRLYVLGHYEDLGIVCSKDRGETWSEVSWLTKGQDWHQAPCNVRYAHGRVYLVMERHTIPLRQYWPVFSIAPVVMSAKVDADLTKRASWTFSSEVSFVQMVDEVGGVSGIGSPFYTIGPTIKGKTGMAARPMSPAGWLETHIVTFPDPKHQWHDPEDRTMYLYSRAHTGMTNLACVSKAVEGKDGSITVQPVTAPSGKPMLYIPLPGGHLKFHIVYDAATKLHWLVSNQSTDSMTRPELLPENRYWLPDNERHRLVLHFSKNCIDWCYAGMIDKTDDARQSRNYPAMVIDGDDLLVLSRSGDELSKNAHDGNLLLLHRVPKFRDLVY
ncbi:MAG: exo-alpha-sialidase [Phycisphaerae bacterium]|nr:exo-alpha-sialidase [Phycisphaerae bacterium]